MENLNPPSTGRPLRRPSLRPARRGLATVEAALVFPLLLLLTFAAIEYGWMFLKQQQITNIARQAARRAATPSATSGDVTSLVSALMTNAGMGDKPYTLTLNNLNGTPGQLLTVSLSLDYSTITVTHMSDPDMLIHIPAPAALSASVAMGKEGP